MIYKRTPVLKRLEFFVKLTQVIYHIWKGKYTAWSSKKENLLLALLQGSYSQLHLVPVPHLLHLNKWNPFTTNFSKIDIHFNLAEEESIFYKRARPNSSEENRCPSKQLFRAFKAIECLTCCGDVQQIDIWNVDFSSRYTVGLSHLKSGYR